MENVQIIAYRFNSSDELEHSGVKNQKWGQRRYQNPDGSLTPLGRIHYGIKSKRTAKKRAENLAKAREAKKAKKIAAEEEAKKKAEQEAAEAKAKKEKEAEKQRIIKSGSAAEALSIVGDLDPTERKYITDRIEWEKSMQKITDEQAAKDKTKVEKLFKGMDKAVDYAQSGIKTYNTVANVVNAFNGERVMPRIDTNIKDGNKKDVKDRKNQVKQQREAAAKRAQQEAEGDAKREERAKKKAEAEKNSQDSQQNSTNTQQTKQSKKEQKAQAKAEKKAAKEQAKAAKSEDKKVYTGTVEGEGKSKSNIKNESNNTKKEKSSDYYKPIDMYEGEVPVYFETKSGNTYRERTVNGVKVKEYKDVKYTNRFKDGNDWIYIYEDELPY